MSRRRLEDIEAIHVDFLNDQFGAVTARDVQIETDTAIRFGGRRPTPIVSGRWDTGDAPQRLMEVLSDLEMIQDDTERGDLPDTDGYGATPSVTANANLGASGTVSIKGNDTSMEVSAVPGGAGIALGSQFAITFANPRATAEYNVLVSYNSQASRSLATNLGPTSMTTTGFTLDSRTAFTSGSTYLIGMVVHEHEY